jgi:type II secretory pathway pseudopilin PulG
MSTTLVLILVGGLLAAGLFVASRWKRYRIRQTATMVMATVVNFGIKLVKFCPFFC